VIKISAVGDVVLAVPSLRAIRSKFPEADIRVLVGLKSRQILKDCPYIDGTIVCDLKGKDKGWAGILKLGSLLRRSHLDTVIDLQNNKISHILSFLSLAPLRYGYKNGKWSFFLNRTVEESQFVLDPIAHQFRALKKLGVVAEDKHLELWPSAEDEKWVEGFLSENWLDERAHILIGLNPGGSSRWITKRWGVENFAKLCDEMARRFNARAVLFGTKEDLALAKDLKSISRSKPVLAVGKTDLMKLASLIKRCRLVVTSDSAPMHIAASLGIPYVALFGPTDPDRHKVSSGNSTIIKKDLNCSPCYKPTCRNMRCMRKITVEEVVNAVGRYLK